jgi:hypothetical protein
MTRTLFAAALAAALFVSPAVARCHNPGPGHSLSILSGAAWTNAELREAGQLALEVNVIDPSGPRAEVFGIATSLDQFECEGDTHEQAVQKIRDLAVRLAHVHEDGKKE